MTVSLRLSLAAMAWLLPAFAVPAIAQAQTTAPMASMAPAASSAPMLMTAPAPAVKHPLRVTTCHPQQGQVYAPTYVGYAPGFYPRYPYYWGDVYGARFYQPPVATNPTLSIDYSNATQKDMSSIEFGLIARGQLVAEVRDVGTFSPGAEIKHRFGLSPNVFPLQTSIVECVPLRIHFADGTHWVNPAFHQIHRDIH
ncbi:MAG: hypothetical protein ACLQPV_11725 [Vulcanimicrobiaceae bacterium]